MYEWRIQIILKSGKELTVYYRGSERTSSGVFEKMFVGEVNTFNGFTNKEKTKNILVRIGEIAAVSIEAA